MHVILGVLPCLTGCLLTWRLGLFSHSLKRTGLERVPAELSYSVIPIMTHLHRLSPMIRLELCFISQTSFASTHSHQDDLQAITHLQPQCPVKLHLSLCLCRVHFLWMAWALSPTWLFSLFPHSLTTLWPKQINEEHAGRLCVCSSWIKHRKVLLGYSSLFLCAIVLDLIAPSCHTWAIWVHFYSYYLEEKTHYEMSQSIKD